MPYNAKPALLGGDSTFSPALPMASPMLPSPESVLPSLERMLRNGHLTKGPELDAFEKESAEYLGARHCVGVSSCTSGLMLCFQALERRLGSTESRKVAVPSFTFLASITALVWAGFEPVFVDVDEKSMNICLDDLEFMLESEDICAVLPVHCFGNPVPMQALDEICGKADVRLLFDAAHGFGSVHQGQKVGTGGWCQVFSLTPTKMVVAGEGGMICTQDDELAEELRIGREYGNDGRYDTVFPGLNARMSEFHACLGRASLGMLEEVVAHRNNVAEKLRQALAEIPGLSFQEITGHSRTTYKDFTLVVEAEAFGLRRNVLAAGLLAEGIPSRKYFSPPCHVHKAFQDYSKRSLPATDRLAESCLSIPLLGEDSVEGIATALKKLHHHSRALSKLGQPA